MNDTYKVGENQGMIQEEIAFYDALSLHNTVEKVLGNEVL